MNQLQQENATIFLGHNIRCLRKRLNLSQEELANHLGLNRGNIASYEKGSAEPKICNLFKLANFFKVSLVDLTRRNLQDDTTLNSASTHFNAFSSVEAASLDDYENKAEELQMVMEGLHSYHNYKMKCFESLPKDMQRIVTNYEKLFELTQELMESHKQLLAMAKCKCPSTS